MNIRSGKETRLVLGGVPRVDLLPPEVGLAAKARVLHRSLSLVVVAAMVVVGMGYGAASLHAANSNAQLATATARTQSLLAQQQKYIEVRKVTSDVKLATAARQVGSSTEIDWKAYLQSIALSLPAGTAIVTFDATSGSPLAEFAQPTVPLQGERIAELKFEATSESLPDVQSWLNSLAKLTGFVDAAPGSVTLSDDGTYKAGITMHVNEKALANRFLDDAAKAKAAGGTEGGSSTTTEASTDGGK
jgi:Tfp pilus assembly protein PilN